MKRSLGLIIVGVLEADKPNFVECVKGTGYSLDVSLDALIRVG